MVSSLSFHMSPQLQCQTASAASLLPVCSLLPGPYAAVVVVVVCGAPQLDLVRLPPKPITKRWLVLRSADSVRVRENPNSQAAHRRAAGVLHKQHALRNLPCTLGT